MISVFFSNRCFIYNSIKRKHSWSSEEDRTVLLICLFVLITFTKCFVLAFRANLLPQEPEVGGCVRGGRQCPLGRNRT